MSLIAQRLLSVLILSGAIASTLYGPPALAQTSTPQADRVTAAASLRATTRLPGHVPAWVSTASEAGSASPETSLSLTLVLTRAADRQAAFEQRLADQQNPGSPRYHHWLTPQQIGTLYGPTQHDLTAITTWLTGQGFAVTDVAPSGIFITAHAPLSSVASAFAISFGQFTLPGPDGKPEAKPRIAATSNPAIPTAFAGIIGSITGLADTPAYPMHHSHAATLSPSGTLNDPEAPATNSSNGAHFLSPNDFSVIYDLNPVFKAGFTGTGQKVAIIGRSRVLAADITNFEALTGLPSVQPNVIVAATGTDPGITNTTDQDEATLDVDRVVGTAPGAQVDLVIAAATNSGLSGLQIAAQYEVNTVLDPIMNISFGACEANAGLAPVTFWDNLFATAAAEGISTFVSAGDSGAAGCQTAGQAPSGTQVRSINYICASSYATCVGGTEFADFASPSTYWNPTNTTGLQSVLSYIPEGAWNESTTTASNGTTTYVASGTGGGASTFIPKPSYQTGTGVPADGFRDVPDVSFSASGHDGYLICLTYKGYTCATTASGTAIGVFGGTSATAPSMAGMAALLNQKKGSSQGNLNPLLYSLASTSPSAFHDATPTTSGVACDLNTPSMCNNSTPSATALTGGLAGYALTAGYDQATGLGSLDANKFITVATIAPSISLTAASSSLTLTAGSTSGNTDALTLTSINYTGAAALSCAVTYNGTGTASFIPTCSVNPASVTLASNGTASSTLTIASTLPHLVRSAAPAVAIATPAPHFFSTAGRLALGSIFLLAFVPTGRRKRTLFALRSWQTLPTALLLLCGMSVLSACSGSSTPVKGNPLLLSQTTTTIPALTSIPSGTSATFVATVVNSGFNTTINPTGTVQFFVNGTTSLGTATLLASGTATSASIPFASAGTFPISASYSGDTNFSPSATPGVPLTVTAAGTSTGSYTVTVTAATPTGVTSISTIALTLQ